MTYSRSKFLENFEENCNSHARDFIAMFDYHEAQLTYRSYFHLLSLAVDTYQYQNIHTPSWETCNYMLKGFYTRYFSTYTQD